jgi:superfamily II DNA/RNA helicase
MPPEITRLADQFLHAPVRVEVAKPAQTAKTITQRLVACGSKDWEKRAKLRSLIDAEEATLKNAIIFCNRKLDVADLLRSLQKHDYSVGALHGDMDQRSRMATLDAFRNNRLKLLVASDVAARGLDIPDVSHVFNFDVPIHAEDYVHRIGRTGRAGRSGSAYMLVTKRDSKSLDAILKLTGDAVEWHDGDMSTVVESPAEEGGRDKGRGRERGKDRGRDRGRDKRDYAPKPNHEAQAFAGLTDEAVPAASSADEPAPKAEKPRQERQERKERPERGERRPAEPKPQRAAEQPRPERSEPRAERERDDRRRDRDNDNAPSPVGFGDELPAFMRNGLK